MNRVIFIGIGLTAGLLIAMGGCTTRPTTLGPDPGLAYTMARDNQILHPEAAQSVVQVEGRDDAATAKITMDRYRSSFEEPEKARKPMSIGSVVSQGVQTR